MRLLPPHLLCRQLLCLNLNMWCNCKTRAGIWLPVLQELFLLLCAEKQIQLQQCQTFYSDAWQPTHVFATPSHWLFDVPIICQDKPCAGWTPQSAM